MLGLGDLSRILGPEGLKLSAAEGDEKNETLKKGKKHENDEKGESKSDKGPSLSKGDPGDPDAAPGPDLGMPPMGMGAPASPQFLPGEEVRDIFSGRTGTVAEQPAGEHGDIIFVKFDEETHPIRNDQLESVGGGMGAPGPSPLGMGGGEGIPAPALLL